MAADRQIAHAKWTPTDLATPHRYDGTCQKCGDTRPAITLDLKTLPFGRGDAWVCQGGCAVTATVAAPTGASRSGGAKAAWVTRRAYEAALQALAAKA